MSDAIHETDLILSPTATLDTQATVEALKAGIRRHAFVFDRDDAMVLGEAEMAIADADDYTRGFEVFGALTDLQKRIKDGYDRFRKPLNELTATVRECEAPQVQQVEGLKKALGTRLTAWKQAFEAEQARVRREAQAAADAAAAAAQAAAAAELETMAATIPDAHVAEALRVEAAAARQTPVHGAPVKTATLPKAAGHTRKHWKARIDDLDALIRAHVDGKCQLPIKELTEALQPWLDKQATQLRQQLAQVYPGTSSYEDEIPIAGRR